MDNTLQSSRDYNLLLTSQCMNTNQTKFHRFLKSMNSRFFLVNVTWVLILVSMKYVIAITHMIAVFLQKYIIIRLILFSVLEDLNL